MNRKERKRFGSAQSPCLEMGYEAGPREELVQKGLLVLWAKNTVSIEVDGEPLALGADELLFLGPEQRRQFLVIDGLSYLQFNSLFHCILEQDQELGCKGRLFFSAAELPKIALLGRLGQKIKQTWADIEEELLLEAPHKLSLLRSLLRNLLIYANRLYLENHQKAAEKWPQEELVREFYYLVNQHFREKTKVSDYAKLLHRSPKTLSNLLKELGHKSPQQYIQERRTLEARRLLIYSNKSIAEISSELGFEEKRSFSRFFKQQTLLSPSTFRQKKEIWLHLREKRSFFRSAICLLCSIQVLLLKAFI